MSTVLSQIEPTAVKRITLSARDLRGIDILCERGEAVKGVWHYDPASPVSVQFLSRSIADHMDCAHFIGEGGHPHPQPPDEFTVDDETYARIQAVTSPDTDSTPSLREKAIALHQEDVHRSQEEQARRAEESRIHDLKQFRGLLKNVLGVELEPDTFEVEIDGLRFRFIPCKYRYEYSEHEHIVLVDTCPKCGNERVSDSIENLFYLGSLLTHERSHQCPRPEPEFELTPPVERTPIVEEQLLSALRTLIQQERDSQ